MKVQPYSMTRSAGTTRSWQVVLAENLVLIVSSNESAPPPPSPPNSNEASISVAVVLLRCIRPRSQHDQAGGL